MQDRRGFLASIAALLVVRKLPVVDDAVHVRFTHSEPVGVLWDERQRKAIVAMLEQENEMLTDMEWMDGPPLTLRRASTVRYGLPPLKWRRLGEGRTTLTRSDDGRT